LWFARRRARDSLPVMPPLSTTTAARVEARLEGDCLRVVLGGRWRVTQAAARLGGRPGRAPAGTGAI
jgi:hypothetical protein